MTRTDEQYEFIKDVAKLLQYAVDNNIKVTAGEMFRTQEQHDLNVKNGLSKAKRSLHQDRQAIDLNLFDGQKYVADGGHPDYKKLGSYWEGLNTKNRWGGNFKGFCDANHFERQL